MTRWYQEKKHEHYYKEAKKQGYRARSAFKLKQIQKKFNIIKKGDTVIDLGAAPGGWSQVVKELVGSNGKVIGIDLLNIKPLADITFIKGDLTKENTIEEIQKALGDKKADIVISDMSPDISGAYSVDQARSIWLCENALKTTEKVLKPRGNFICKAFVGEDLKDFIDEVKKKFNTVKCHSPSASRKSSSEIYIIALKKQKY